MQSTRRKFILPAAASLLVAACGGGGGDDSSSGPAAPPPGQPPPTGSAKAVFVSGAISGFGSVIVNGVRYDTTGTEVRVDDRAGAVAELRVGQVVRVEAEVDDRGQARARRIEQEHLLSGTVQSVDAASGAITVAGQVVRIDDDTSFDDSIGGSLAGIAVGDRIEVHGFAGSDGQARATRLERADANETEVEVTGLVAGLDTVARRFSVGSLRVDYSTATLEDFGVGESRQWRPRRGQGSRDPGRRRVACHARRARGRRRNRVRPAVRPRSRGWSRVSGPRPTSTSPGGG